MLRHPAQQNDFVSLPAPKEKPSISTANPQRSQFLLYFTVTTNTASRIYKLAETVQKKVFKYAVSGIAGSIGWSPLWPP